MRLLHWLFSPKKHPDVDEKGPLLRPLVSGLTAASYELLGYGRVNMDADGKVTLNGPVGPEQVSMEVMQTFVCPDDHWARAKDGSVWWRAHGARHQDYLELVRQRSLLASTTPRDAA